MGAPITAYNRISDEVIRVHSNIYDPEFVVVVDESLLETVDVTAGLKKEGAILVNTARPKEEIIPHLKGYEGKLYTIDAHKVSMEAMGRYFPNTPLAKNCKSCKYHGRRDIFKRDESFFQT